jgi:hypothetical protein
LYDYRVRLPWYDYRVRLPWYDSRLRLKWYDNRVRKDSNQTVTGAGERRIQTVKH